MTSKRTKLKKHPGKRATPEEHERYMEYHENLPLIDREPKPIPEPNRGEVDVEYNNFVAKEEDLLVRVTKPKLPLK